MAKWAYTEVGIKHATGSTGSQETAYFCLYGDDRGKQGMDVNQVGPYIKKLGLDGWELVSVLESQADSRGMYPGMTRYYFKKAYQ